MSITASELLNDDVEKGFEELVTLLGKTVTYSRFESKSGNPSEGYTKNWWEQDLSFEAIVGRISSYIASQDSRLQQSDRKLIFRQSEFTSQAPDDEAVPEAGDEIMIDGEKWTTELEDDTLWNSDETGQLFKVFVRKAT